MRLAVRCSTEGDAPFVLEWGDIVIKVVTDGDNAERTPHLSFGEDGKGTKRGGDPAQQIPRDKDCHAKIRVLQMRICRLSLLVPCTSYVGYPKPL
jgi:hypothetical protein